MHGAKQDFDIWSYLGCSGWSWDEVLSTFKAIENYDGGASNLRGGDGPLDVVKNYPVNPVQEAILEAGVEIGLPINEDYNDGAVDGISRMQRNVRDGKRLNAWRAYLKPIAGHQNLRIITAAQGDKLIIEDDEVLGVEYEHEGRRYMLRADETILAAGALGSPEVLLRSGIGPFEELLAAGVQPVLDRPEVGKNLQDHFLAPVSTRPIPRYPPRRPGRPKPTTSDAASRIWRCPTPSRSTSPSPCFRTACRGRTTASP